jgi:hypothetical protein
MKDVSNMGMSQSASVISNKEDNISLGVIDYFTVECYDIDGNFKWKETIKNLVTTEGLNHVLNVIFKSDTQEANWYVGLKDVGSPLPADTGANLPSSNANWVEYTEYYVDSPGEASARPALTLGTVSAGSVDNSLSVATFNIESPAPDVYGVFVTDGSVKNSASGADVLYGVGDFQSGAKTGLAAGDTLNVTVTLSATSA